MIFWLFVLNNVYIHLRLFDKASQPLANNFAQFLQCQTSNLTLPMKG